MPGYWCWFPLFNTLSGLLMTLMLSSLSGLGDAPSGSWHVLISRFHHYSIGDVQMFQLNLKPVHLEIHIRIIRGLISLIFILCLVSPPSVNHGNLWLNLPWLYIYFLIIFINWKAYQSKIIIWQSRSKYFHSYFFIIDKVHSFLKQCFVQSSVDLILWYF